MLKLEYIKKYDPTEINEWCYEKNMEDANTALCAYCGIDSVVPNKLINYTDEDLIKWNQQGFQTTYNIENNENDENNKENTLENTFV